MADRTILHCDCNAYYASVECLFHPELKSIPMAVCGDPDSRHGIILAKNEPAKRYGIKTAETIWQARQKCPNLVLVPARHDEYRRYCNKINQIYGEYTSYVEAFSIDESWLDVTGSLHLFGSGETIANTLRRRIREEIGITISVGVSFNKIFAKLGSDYKKPDATTVITQENYQELLYPLPITDMLFVGRKAAEKLRAHGIQTIGALAALPKERAAAWLGRSGETIWDYANGLDESPVRQIGESDPVKSIGNGITFRRNLTGAEDVRAGLKMLADSVGARLRAAGLYCQTVQIQIKDPSFKVISRQQTLSRPIHLTRELYDTAFDLVCKSWNLQKPIRLLSLTAAHLTDSAQGGQITFFDAPAKDQDKRENLERAIDTIRKRFGKEAVGYASILKTDLVAGRREENDAISAEPPDGAPRL